MKKLSISLFAMLAIILAVASAFTSAPKEAQDTTVWEVFIGTGYSGSQTEPSEVIQAQLPRLEGYEEVPFEDFDTQGELDELKELFCVTNPPICLILVKREDEVYTQVVVIFGEFIG